MPRDGSGVYTLPAGNPVVTDTVIASTWANSTLSDIAAQLNNVYTRDGTLGPAAPFKIMDGTVGAPGLAFNSEPSSGFYRPGAGEIAVSILGVSKGSWTSTGFSVAGNVIVSGGMSVAGGFTSSGIAAFTQVEALRLTSTQGGIYWRAGGTEEPPKMAIGRIAGGMMQSVAAEGHQWIHTGMSNLEYVHPNFTPGSDLLLNLGSPSKRWSTVYSNTGSFAGNVTAPSFTAAAGVLAIDAPAGQNKLLQFSVGGVLRWYIYTSDDANGGSLLFNRYNNAGAYLSTPMFISRTDGTITFNHYVAAHGGMQISNGLTILTGNLTVNGAVNLSGTNTVTAGSFELGGSAVNQFPIIDFHSGPAMIDFDSRIAASGGNGGNGNGVLGYTAHGGHNFQGVVNTGPINATADIQIHGGSNLKLTSSAGHVKSIRCYTNNNFEWVNHAYNSVICDLTDDGLLCPLRGYRSRSGQNGATQSTVWNFQYDGNVAVWIDSTRIGWIDINASDERVKHSIAQMPLMSEAAFSLIQPIKYRWANVGAFIDDGKDHWGFSAQNVAMHVPAALMGDITEVDSEGNPQPAAIDKTAIVGQLVLQVQSILSRLSSAGL